MIIFAIEGNCNNVDWFGSAVSQDNLRVVKMTLETTQLLCTALNVLSEDKVTPYKSAHVNHPCSKWARASSANWKQLYYHALCLCSEYTRRFGKTHKCDDVLSKIFRKFLENKHLFELDVPTDLPLCMPDEYKDQNDIVGSYRRFWCSKPNIVYPEQKIPSWFKQQRQLPYKIISEV